MPFLTNITGSNLFVPSPVNQMLESGSSVFHVGLDLLEAPEIRALVMKQALRVDLYNPFTSSVEAVPHTIPIKNGIVFPVNLRSTSPRRGPQSLRSPS